MPDTFNDLRPRIVDYLYDRGIDPQKRFRCLNFFSRNRYAQRLCFTFTACRIRCGNLRFGFVFTFNGLRIGQR